VGAWSYFEELFQLGIPYQFGQLVVLLQCVQELAEIHDHSIFWKSGQDVLVSRILRELTSDTLNWVSLGLGFG